MARRLGVAKKTDGTEPVSNFRTHSVKYLDGESWRPVVTKNVLIIGDSISINYTPHVINALWETANVRHNAANAQDTGNGLNNIPDPWVGDTQWDVIHFNFGLWDLRYNDQSGLPTVTTYASRLETIAARLLTTGATVQWASTTYVPSPRNNVFCDPGVEVTWNASAKTVMDAVGITIDDLHALSSTWDGAYPRLPTDDVHFNDAGYTLLGAQVASSISALLN